MKGGKRPGSGRPQGSRNKRTVELEAKARAAAEAVEAVIPNAFHGDAHAFLIAIYKDPTQPIALRVDAAKAAMTREKPALASIDVTSQNEHVVHVISGEPVDRDGEAWLEAHSKPH